MRKVDILVNSGAILDDVLRALIGAGVSIRSCSRHEPDLEDAFTRILDAEEPRA